MVEVSGNPGELPEEAASELSDRLGPPPFAGETNKETLPDGSSYRSAYSFRVF